jgi:hypothetical protein
MVYRKEMCVFVFFISQLVLADSPITYTNFHHVYSDVDFVKKATIVKGKLSQELLVFLGDENQKLEHKLALINAIGWEHKHNNSKIFLNYIVKKKKYKGPFKDNNYGLLMDYGTPDEQACYAYLRANENYFDLSAAFAMADKAKNKSNSFGVHFVYHLIKAQICFAINEHCIARNEFLAFGANTELYQKFKVEAIPFLFEYIITSTENCVN